MHVVYDLMTIAASQYFGRAGTECFGIFVVICGVLCANKKY